MRPPAIVKPNATRGAPACIQTRPRHAAEQRRPRGPGPAGESPGHCLGTENRRRCAGLYGCGVGLQHDIGVEQRQQPAKIAVARRREERVDDLALTARVHLGHRVGAADTAPSPARQLPGRRRTAADDSRDVLERHCEHVVQDECHPLRRSQRLEDDQQGHAQRVGQQQLPLRVRAHVRRRLGHLRA
jgi:hypothetical protein